MKKHPPTKKARAIVLQSMRKFADHCEQQPFLYSNPVAERKPSFLTRTQKETLQAEARYFADGVNRRLAEVNALRIERYKEFQVITSQ